MLAFLLGCCLLGGIAFGVGRTLGSAGAGRQHNGAAAGCSVLRVCCLLSPLRLPFFFSNCGRSRGLLGRLLFFQGLLFGTLQLLHSLLGALTVMQQHFLSFQIGQHGAVRGLKLLQAVIDRKALVTGRFTRCELRRFALTKLVYALVKAGDKFFYAVKEVKVTLGGCGG